MKLTPRVNHASATVTVNGTAVMSGRTSDAIALSEGSNTITVQVTAQDSSTKDYTVTVIRGARLTGLSLTVGGNAVTLSPSFTPGYTDRFTATVPHDATSVSVTPTWTDTGATVEVGRTRISSSGGSATVNLASCGDTRVRVHITNVAETWTHQVIVKRQSSNADLCGLTASRATSAGGTYAALTLAPSFSPTTTSYTATVANSITHVKLTPTVSHASATVTVNGAAVGSGTASEAIALSEGSNTVTVRVTAQDSSTRDYTVTITRQPPPATVTLSASPNPVPEGDSVTVTATLSAALTSNVTIPVTLTDNTAESGDHGTLSSITINANSTTGTGTITTNQDTDKEDETFTVALGTLPSEVTAGSPSSVRITINDDGGPPKLTGLTVRSSTDGRRFSGTVTLSPAFDPLTEVYAAAVAGDVTHVRLTVAADYAANDVVVVERPVLGQQAETTKLTAASPTADVALNRGANEIWVVLTRDDGTGRQNTYRLTITRGGGGGVGGTTPTVRLSAAPNPVPEGSSVTVTATLSSALGSDVTVPLTLTAGTAESGDYGALASITIDAGSTSGTGTVTTNQDIDTADETFTVALGSLPSSVRAGSPSSVRVTIRDDDGGTTPTTPSVSLSAAPNPVPEGSSVTVTATLSSALGSDVTIPLTLTAGTAETADYGALASITIDAGSTSGAGTVTTNQDTDTADETFTVALGSLPSSVRAGSPSSVRVTISDDDGGTTPTTPTVSLSASPNPVPEGDPVTVTATLSQTLSSNVTIPVTITDDTAESGDHGALSSITISSGSTTGSGTISTSQDSDTENETFTVALGTLPSAVTAGSPASVSVTIRDDDGGVTPSTPTVSLSASPNPVPEGDPVTVTATLSAALETAVSIPLTLTAGTAEDGDYGSLRAIRINAGATTGTGRIHTADDAGANDETFTVALGTLPASVTAGSPSSVEITIRDGDPSAPPTVSLSAAPNPVTEGDTVTVTAALSRALKSAVTIPLTLTAGSAEDGDYGELASITVEAGSTTGTGLITTSQDPDAENETFTVALGNLPPSVQVGDPASVEVTISDDEDTTPTVRTVSLSASPNPVEEGSPVTVTATLSAALPGGVTIALTLTPGTAEQGDYGALPSITIDAGATSGTGTVTTAQDADTDDETFTVALGSLPSSVTAGSPSSVEITIADDDEDTTYSLSASARAVEEGGEVTITATTSQAVAANTEVELMRDADSTAGLEDYSLAPPLITIMMGDTEGSLTLTATDDDDVEGDESLTLNGTAAGDLPAGSVTLTITDNDRLTYTLSGPEDMNLVEGKSYELTATASSAVKADTTVTLKLDAAASSANPDDYSVGNITIAAGETEGTTMLVVTEDELPDGGTGTNVGEKLVLHGSVGEMRVGTLRFTLWDAAVPALPIIAQILLAALLSAGGYRRYRQRP